MCSWAWELLAAPGEGSAGILTPALATELGAQMQRLPLSCRRPRAAPLNASYSFFN